MARKNSKENPFDEQSQSNRKGHNKEQKLKFSLKDFKKLPKEEQIEIAKKQANSENGFAHHYILDIYNKSIVGDIGSTGKSSSYKKAPKPDANRNTEKAPNNQNEIKDLSQLATFKGDFPESAPVNEKAEQIQKERRKNTGARETAIKKAGNLDPEKGEGAMQNALAGVVKEEGKIIATTEEKIGDALEGDKTVTPEETINTTEAKQPTKAEMLAQLQKIQKEKQQNAEEVAKLKEEKAQREEKNEKLAKVNTTPSPEPKKEGDIPVPPEPKDDSSEELDNNIDPKPISLDDEKIKLVQELNSLLDEENKIKEEYFDLQGKIELNEKKLKEIDILNQKIEEVARKKDFIEININQIISKNSNYENDKEYKKLKDEFTNLDQENQNLNNNLTEIKQNINITEVDKERFNYLAIKRKEINDKLDEKTIELEKLKITKIQTKNDKVLEEFENTTYLNVDDSPTESNIKGISSLQKEFFKNATEKVKNALNKGLEWLNKDEKELTNKEKISRKILTAGMIGASIFGIGEISQLSNNNVHRIWIRSAMAGLISSLTTWSVTQKTINNIKNQWDTANKWTKAGMILIGAGAGAGLAISFLGTSTIVVTGTAIGAKLFANKKFENWENKIKNDLDINSFAGSLDDIEKQKEELNRKLRKIKMYKALANGAIAIFSGVGSMVANQIEFNLKDNTQNLVNQKHEYNITKQDTIKNPEGKSWWSKLFAKKEISNRSIAENKYGNPEDLKESLKLKPENNLPKFIKSSENNSEISQEATKVDRTLLDKDQKPILEDTRAEEDKIDLKKINEKIINTNQTDNSIQEPVQEEKELEAEHSQKPETNTENTTNEETTVEKSNVTEEETNTTEQNKASEVKPIENTEKVTGDKVDIKTIKPESTIDSQKNVGETYVYRSLIREDNELAEKLAKYQELNLDKVDDDRYMANYLKKLAIKLGRMDDEGHEIRYNQKAVDNVSLKLDVDKDGKLISYEIDKEGVVKDVHHEGDQFQKDLEDYEETKLQKTYSKIDEAYEKNGGLVKPEKVVPTLGDPFSGSYFNGDDNQEYLENQAKNNARITPDSLQEEEIVAPEKINNTYKLENIANYKDWDKIKDLSLKTFLERSQYSDMYGEEGKQLMVSLKGINDKVLEFVDNDDEFNKFILSNPDLTVEEATNLYKNITEEQSFTDELKEKYGFYDWKDRLAENIKLNEKEIKELKAFKDVMKGDNEVKKIFKLNYGKKIFDNENDFLNNKEVRAIYSEYNKNIKALDKKMFGDLTQTMKNNTVNNYLEKNENILTDYLTEVREKLGDLAKPQWNLGAGEKIDEYLKRITALAKIKRINIDPKLILKQEDINKPELDEIEKYRPSSSFKEDTGNLSKIKNDELKEYKPNEEGTSDNEYRSFKQDAKKGDTEDYSKYKPYNKN